MSIEILGYYTSDSCVVGWPKDLNEEKTALVVRSDKESPPLVMPLQAQTMPPIEMVEVLSQEEDLAMDNAIRTLESHLLDNTERDRILVDNDNAGQGMFVAEKHPDIQLLLEQFDLVENNQKRKLLIDKLIGLLEKNDPSQVINRDHRTYNYVKAAVIFFVIDEVVDKYNIQLSPHQLSALMGFYYSQCGGGGFSILLKYIHDLARRLASRFSPLLKQIAPLVSDKTGLTGTRKKIFDSYLVFLSAKKEVPQDKLEQVSMVLGALQPNQNFPFLDVISVAPPRGGEREVGSQQQVGMILVESISTDEIDALFTRFEGTLGIRSPEEIFPEVLVHEYYHNLQRYNPLITEMCDRVFAEVDVFPHNKSYFLGDYFSNRHYRDGEYSSAEYSFQYAPNSAEFGAVYAEAIAKDSYKSFEIAMERAAGGNYVPLAMVLVALGSLSQERGFVHFMKIEAVDGRVELKAERIAKKTLLDSIPRQYLEAITQKYAIPVEDLLDLGIMQI
jgi:hypothetical protein